MDVNPFDEKDVNNDSTDKNAPIALPFDEPSQQAQGGTVAKGDRALWYTIGGITVSACIVMILITFSLYNSMQSQIKEVFAPPPTPRPAFAPNQTATQRAAEFSLSDSEAQATASSAATQWDVFFLDDFSNNENEWKTGVNEGDFSTIVREIKDGKYIWNATATDNFVGWLTPPAKNMTQDFIASIEGRASGSPSAEYGIMFRKDFEGNYYFLRLSNNGRFKLSLNFKDEWITIINWTYSPLIKKDEVNRITVMGQGSQFLFFINDVYAASAYDENLKLGLISMGISLDEDEQAVFEFDNFEIRVPTLVPTPGPESMTATQHAWVRPSLPPTLASAEEALIANEKESVNTLRQRSIITPDQPEINQPGDVYIFEIYLNQSEPLRWTYGWCAATEQILEKNFAQMKIEFFANSAPVSSNHIATHEYQRSTESGGGSCRSHITLITDWPPGHHQLEIHVTFLQPTDDGWDLYPAGTHIFKYLVNVRP